MSPPPHSYDSASPAPASQEVAPEVGRDVVAEQAVSAVERCAVVAHAPAAVPINAVAAPQALGAFAAPSDAAAAVDAAAP